MQFVKLHVDVKGIIPAAGVNLRCELDVPARDDDPWVGDYVSGKYTGTGESYVYACLFDLKPGTIKLRVYDENNNLLAQHSVKVLP